MKLYSPYKKTIAPPIASSTPAVSPIAAPMISAAPPTTMSAIFCPAPRCASAAAAFELDRCATGARMPTVLAALVGPADGTAMFGVVVALGVAAALEVIPTAELDA